MKAMYGKLYVYAIFFFFLLTVLEKFILYFIMKKEEKSLSCYTYHVSLLSVLSLLPKIMFSVFRWKFWSYLKLYGT